MNNNIQKILKNFSSETLEINVSNMDIEGELDLRKYSKIKKLDCSNNKITCILLNFSTELEYFDLSNNLVTNLENNRYSSNFHLNYTGNPIEKLFYPYEYFVNEYPSTLKKITFSDKFNDVNGLNTLPKSITHINFGSDFNQKIYGLHKGIIEIKFGSNFNQEIYNLPDTITHIIFGVNFNQSVDNLPNNLTNLSFGQKFNQPIDNLPNTLKYLSLQDDFNQPIDNLPNLQTLIVGSKNFNQSLDNLPNTLEILHFTNGENFSYNLNNLPDSITEIRLTYKTDDDEDIQVITDYFTPFDI